MKNDHQRAPRGDVGGWSEGATRRNTRFLYSVQEDQLDGHGWTATLTLKHCPPSAEAWHRIRRAWIKRMERLGLVRLHWVTEWQKRGVPHLHCALWFSEEAYEKHGIAECYKAMNLSWLAVAAEYEPRFLSQYFAPINDAIGWFQYLSKHAARGVKHYQRSAESIPPAWKQKTGRMWGHTGQWSVKEAVRINLEGAEGDGGFFAFRRLVRSWRHADARAAQNRHRIRLARRMLACNARPLSEVRGLSEWVPEGIQEAMLANLATRGYRVTC